MAYAELAGLPARALADPLPQGGWVIVAAEPITDVDTTACDMLEDLTTALDQQGKRLVLAELQGPVRRKLTQYGLDSALPDDRFFPTVAAAVDAYRATTGQEWVAADQ